MKSILKTILIVFAIMLILMGGAWTLQGLSILPGTFMRGNPQWVINGAVTALVGAGLLWFASRKK